ncbi:MAG TPA: DUF262 domain-containing protein [Thermoplasmata archaeon]|nr:DUF262 domain-containing protein [Thermoplasmata archaeon]
MDFSTITVHDLVDRAVRGEFDIPEFQRDFVWRPDQVTALSDSLYRDYPIGQLLTWEHADEVEPRGAKGAPLPKVWLVDGQQRATALCLLFGKKPYWWSSADDWNHWSEVTNVLAKVGGADPEIELGLANPVRSSDPRWVGLRSILSIGESGAGDAGSGPLLEIGRTLLGRLPAPAAAGLTPEILAGRLRALWEIRARVVPIATVHREIEDVAEIFRRLNQQGTDIVEADVTLATAASTRAGWVRDEFLPFLKNLAEAGYDIPTGVAVRALTAVGTGQVRLQDTPRDFWSGPGFEAAWDSTRQALSFVVGGLVGAGAITSALLPSRNALIPLVALRAKYPSEEFLFPRALHWTLLALRDGRYGGSGSTNLAQDLRTIRDSANFSEAIEGLRGELESGVRVQPGEFRERWTWSRPLVLLLYLAMYEHRARDLVTGQRLGHSGSESTPDLGQMPFLHPFFPKGRTVLRDPHFDYTDEEVNALANIVFLNQRPKDRRWSNAAPSTYFEGPAIPGRQLDEQGIPLNRALWEPGRYRDFLLERSKLLAKLSNDYLASLLGAPRGSPSA